ncbi:MAG: TadE/TadG family type IV pilus assembly protein [Chloroflexota bacterium]
MRRLRSQRRYTGQGLVEFAVVLPVFLLLTLGVIELGWLLYNNHTLTNATREGARYAMVNGERSGNNSAHTEIQTIVTDHADGLPGSISTEVDPEDIGEPGTQLTVRAYYDYQPLVGVVVGISPFQLSSESTVIVQY